MVRKKWVVSECDKKFAAQMAEEFDIDEFTAYLLASRGITDDLEVEEFLAEEPLLMLDPFSIADMDAAAVRIAKAIDDYEKIAVFGDYDADGITATALLYSYLESRGANVISYIPDRLSEGYGLNCGAVRALAEAGINLIVTVDNGVSAIEEAKLAKELGVDLIVTDHHKVGDELPDAIAVVDPHRPDCPSDFKELSGVGVAFKLIGALEDGDEDAVLDEYADLVALGTIGDVVTLKGENRALVKKGLEVLENNPRIGIASLLEKAGASGKKVTASLAAYTICPRINATGRMSSADKALRLLLCDDEYTAAELAEEINAMNVARQKTETEIVNGVTKRLEEEPELLHDKVIVIEGEGWHQGVIGIVASRIVERYGKPTVVISTDGDKARGSCRSIEGFSIFDALTAVEDCLDHFGGHTLAAGISLDSVNIPELRRRINEYAKNIEMPFPVQRIDCRLNPAGIDIDLIYILDVLEPFGTGNPQPCFGLFGMTLDDVTSIGDGRHIRLTVSKNGCRLNAMFFGVSEKQFPYSKGEKIDLAVNLDRNVYNGEERVSVSVKNIRLNSMNEPKVLESIRLYEKLLGNEALSPEQAAQAYPDRDFQVRVFKYVKSAKPMSMAYEIICKNIGDDGSSLCKAAVTVDAMTEMGIMAKNAQGRLYIPEVGKKVDLNEASIMKKIIGQL